MAVIESTKSFPTVDTLVNEVAADTSTAGSAFIGYTAQTIFDVRLDVTAASGTSKTLDVIIEHSSDLGVTWTTLDTFTQATGVTSAIRRISAAHGDQIRARWIIGGTNASFDFTVQSFIVKDNAETGVAVTASGIGTAKTGYAAQTKVITYLNVTAATGTTPTLDVIIEHSSDLGVTWATLDTFTQAIAAGSQTRLITAAHGDQLRANFTVGGTTPSFDFTVDLLIVKDTLANRVAENETTITSAFSGFSGANFIIAQLNVTAASGTTPTLDVKLQHSIDGTTWLDVASGAFTQKVAAGTQDLILSSCVWGDQLRVVSAIGGTTPSFDYTVKLFAKN